MQAHPYQPDRRTVLRAGSASLAAIATALCAASHAAATSTNQAEAGQEFLPGQGSPELAGHRHIIGVL
ncbi:hypothetical protein [Arthrobacter sp. ISL-30]|uniref:hypothetical protein n=1 Tax=Arthrobacter sp. ISL-30 TaxID=2819109 RepID=UPI001BEAB36E|nr:hypothetical protein [Arthrobacter sp. ISL-30]MBT2514635.1 hypothetical protein [Arthrobacter sp. ISL-30]